MGDRLFMGFRWKIFIKADYCCSVFEFLQLLFNPPKLTNFLPKLDRQSAHLLIYLLNLKLNFRLLPKKHALMLLSLRFLRSIAITFPLLQILMRNGTLETLERKRGRALDFGFEDFL